MGINPQKSNAIKPIDVYKDQRSGTIFYKEGKLNDPTFPGEPDGIYESWKYSFDAGRQVFRSQSENKIYEKRLVKDSNGNPRWTGWMEIPDVESRGIQAIAINDLPLALPNADGAIRLQITPALMGAYTRQETYDLIDEKVSGALDSQYEYVPWPLDHGIPINFPGKVPEALGPLQLMFPQGVVGKIYIVEPKPHVTSDDVLVEDMEDYFIWARQPDDSYAYQQIGTPVGPGAFVTYAAFNDHKEDTDIHLRVRDVLNPDGTPRTERDEWNEAIAANDLNIETHKADDSRHISLIHDPDSDDPLAMATERELWMRRSAEFVEHRADLPGDGANYDPDSTAEHISQEERQKLNETTARFNNHEQNITIHVTQEDKNKWNAQTVLPNGEAIYDIFSGLYHKSANQYKYSVQQPHHVEFEQVNTFNGIPYKEFTQFVDPQDGTIHSFAEFFAKYADQVITAIQLEFGNYNTGGNDMQFQVGTNEDGGTPILAVSEVYNSGKTINPPSLWDIYNATYITKGEWAPSVQYLANDMVFYRGLKYVAKVDNLGNPPVVDGFLDVNHWYQLKSENVSYFTKLVVKLTGNRPLVAANLHDVKVHIQFKSIKGIEIGDPNSTKVLPLDFVGPENTQPTYNGKSFRAASLWGTLQGSIGDQKDLTRYVGAGLDQKVTLGDVNSKKRFDIYQKSLIPSLVREKILDEQVDVPVSDLKTMYDIPTYYPIFRDILSQVDKNVTSKGNYPLSITIRAALVANQGITNNIFFRAISKPLNDPNDLNTPLKTITNCVEWNKGSPTSYAPGTRVKFGWNEVSRAPATWLTSQQYPGFFVAKTQTPPTSSPVRTDGTIDSTNWEESIVSLETLESILLWNQNDTYVKNDKVSYKAENGPIEYFVAVADSQGRTPRKVDGTIDPVWSLMYPNWNATTNYLLDEEVIYQARRFRSIINNNRNYPPILLDGNVDTDHWSDEGSFINYIVVAESVRTTESGPLSWVINPYVPFDQILTMGVSSITDMQCRISAYKSADITAGHYNEEDYEGIEKGFKVLGNLIENESHLIRLGKAISNDPVSDPHEPVTHVVDLSTVLEDQAQYVFNNITNQWSYDRPIVPLAYEPNFADKFNINGIREIVRVYGQELDDRYASRFLFEKGQADLHQKIDDMFNSMNVRTNTMNQDQSDLFNNLRGASTKTGEAIWSMNIGKFYDEFYNFVDNTFEDYKRATNQRTNDMNNTLANTNAFIQNQLNDCNNHTHNVWNQVNTNITTLRTDMFAESARLNTDIRTNTDAMNVSISQRFSDTLNNTNAMNLSVSTMFDSLNTRTDTMNSATALMYSNINAEIANMNATHLEFVQNTTDKFANVYANCQAMNAAATQMYGIINANLLMMNTYFTDMIANLGSNSQDMFQAHSDRMNSIDANITANVTRIDGLISSLNTSMLTKMDAMNLAASDTFTLVNTNIGQSISTLNTSIQAQFSSVNTNIGTTKADILSDMANFNAAVVDDFANVYTNIVDSISTFNSTLRAGYAGSLSDIVGMFDSYYTKVETDALLDLGSFDSVNNLVIAGLDHLEAVIDIANYYNKIEINTNFYVKSDVYNKHELDLKFDEYYGKGEIDDMFSDYYNRSEIDDILVDYYTSAETDEKFSEYYDRAEIDGFFENYYDKTETDDLFGNYYNKTEIDGFLADYTTTAGLETYGLNITTANLDQDVTSLGYIKNTDLPANFDQASWTEVEKLLPYVSLLESIASLADGEYVLNVDAGAYSFVPKT
jgi:hypothetical protein